MASRPITLSFELNQDNIPTALFLDQDSGRTRFVCFQKIPGYGCDSVPYKIDDSGLQLQPLTTSLTHSITYLIELFGYVDGSDTPIPLSVKKLNEQVIPNSSRVGDTQGFTIRVEFDQVKFAQKDESRR